MEREQFLSQVSTLRQQGLTVRAIAAELGLHPSRVQRALKALNQGISADPAPNQGVSPYTGALAGNSFVGRQQERSALRTALEDSLSGRGRLVMLVGEPGIGKTRTAQELAAYAQARGAAVLWGRCYEGIGMPSYWPWIQAIRSYVRGQEPERLRFEMGSGAGDIAEIVPEVRELLLDLEPSPTLDSPEQARFRLFDSIVNFLKATSQARPLALIFDNLHWADRPSLLLLEFLAQEVSESHVLCIGTYRDEEVSHQHLLSHTLGELTKERHFQRVPLVGLDQANVRDLIELLAGNIPAPALVEAVYRKTQGNPLFVTEVVRLLLQEGRLTQGNHQEGVGISLGIPDGVKEAIGRRLYRLSDSCNHVLTVASVIGREFGLDLLERLIPDLSGERLLERLEEALRARIVEEVHLAVGRYQFTHVLVQETLAGKLSAARRARLHREIGEALEQLYADDLETHAAQLAHHFSQAEPGMARDKFVRYSLLAGERALATYAYEEALEHFHRGLAARGVPLAGNGRAEDAEAAALLFGLGRAQMASLQRYQIPEALGTLSRAFNYHVQAGEINRAVAVAMYPVVSTSGMLGQAIQLISRALEVVPPGSPEAGRLFARYGRLLGIERGDYVAAQDAFDQALTIAHNLGDLPLQMQTLAESAQVAYFHLRYPESLERSLRAVELINQVEDTRLKMLAHFFGWVIPQQMGDPMQAEPYAKVMLELAVQTRDTTWMASALIGHEFMYRLRGDWTAARECSERALAVAPLDIRLIYSRMLMEYEVGDFGSGETYLTKLLEVMRLTPPSPTWEYTCPALGIPIISRIAGKVEPLAEVANAIHTVQSSSASPLMATMAETGQALMAVMQGDVGAAGEKYTRLRHLQGLMFIWAINTDRVLGLLAHTVGNLDQAAHHFEDALAFCRKAGYRPELAWSLYDYADALRQRNRPGDRARAELLLDEAVGIATELGMKPLLERLQDVRGLVGSAAAKPPDYPAGLTQREVEVLRLLASGQSSAEIAAELVLSRRTVERHISNIYSKTNTHSRSQATAFAFTHGLAPPA